MKKISIMLIIVLLFTSLPLTAIAKSSCKHRWGKYRIVKRATINRLGIKVKRCSKCGKKHERYIKRLKPFAKLNRKTLTLKKGKAFKLKVKMARGDKVRRWKTNRRARIRLNQKGKIRALKAGKARVTVILRSGKRATCIVTVKKATRGKGSPKKRHSGTVYWTPHGRVWHVRRSCPTLSRSRVVLKGTIKQSGKPRCCKVCG